MPDIVGAWLGFEELVGFVVTRLAAVVVVVILVDSVELVDLVVVATVASVEVELVTLGGTVGLFVGFICAYKIQC